LELEEFFAQVRKSHQLPNFSEAHEALVNDMSAKLFRAFDYFRGGLALDQAFIVMSHLLLLRLLSVLREVREHIPAAGQAIQPLAFLPEWERWVHLTPDAMLEDLLDMGIQAAHTYTQSMPTLEQNILTACQGHIGARDLTTENIVAAASIVGELSLSPEQATYNAMPVHVAALGVAYEQALSRILSRTWSGYEPTPEALARLMVGLANPQPGEHLYDPACGSARLLIGALQQASNGKALGIDVHPDACTIGILNLLLHGYPDVLLQQSNALEHPLPFFPNVILAHPPFGGKVGQRLAERVHLVQTTELDLVFLQHIIEQVERGARAVIAVPDGVLVKPNNAATTIRRYLVEEQLLEAVISLPPGLFMPATSVKGSLLVLAPTARQQHVWYYAFDEKRSTKEPLSDLEITRAVEGFAKAMIASQPGGRGWTKTAQELAKNGYILQAQPPTKQTKQDGLPPNLATQPLQATAQLINRGTPYSRGQTTNREEFEKLLESAGAEDEESRKDLQAKWKGLIRVGDITFGKVQKTELLIAATAIKLQGDTPYLQAGDVLLSVEGTIGKVAICTARQEGFIFSGGLTRIRCSDDLLPEFLAEYLRSNYIQQQLKSLANNAPGKSIGISKIGKIPVPSISVDHQRGILAKVKAGNDLLAALRELDSTDLDDENRTQAFIAQLVHDNAALQTLVTFQERQESLSPDEVYDWLDQQAAGIHTLRNSSIHELKDGESSAFIDATLASLSSAVDRLRLAVRTPSLQERLDELDRIQVSLRRHRAEFEPSQLEPQTTALLDLALAGMEAALFALSEPILASTSISLRVEPESLPVGEETQIHILVENSGPVPADAVAIEIPALAEIILQSEQYTGIRIPKLKIQGDRYTKTYRVCSDKAALIRSTAHWTARDIHGDVRRGEIPISFSFVDSARRRPYLPIPRNPYITGTPVNGEEMFFGREDVINFLQANLLGTHQNNVLLLEGNRRTGKSSLLKQVERGSLLKETIPVYIDCQGLGELTEHKLFFKVAHHIANALQKQGLQVNKPQRTDIDPADAFWDFRQLLAQYLAAAAGRHVVLLFDEFEYLDIAIKDGKLPERVMENLRHVFQHYAGLGVVLTGSHRLTKLREEYWSALFGLTLRKNIGALDRQAAKNLVTKPLQSFVQFTPEAVDYMVDLAACQPYFIQMIAHTLVSDLQQKQDTSLITPSRIEVILPAAIEAASEHLKYMVNHARLARQRALLAFIAKQQNIAPVTHQDLMNFLSVQGIESNANLLAQDLELLGEHDLVIMDGRNQQNLYGIPIELLRYWIQDHIDLDDVVARAAADV
jgi:type I restriction enzyme M protein